MTYTTNGAALDSVRTARERLAAAFAALGHRMRDLSGDGFVDRVECGDRSVCFTAGALPLNSASSHLLAEDKLSTYQVLHDHGIRIPPGFAFFAGKYGEYDLDLAPESRVESLAARTRREFPWFESREGARLVVKPGRGSRGAGVAVCRSIAEVEAAAAAALKLGHYGLVQAYVPGTEYRVALLDDQLLVGYAKVPAVADAPAHNLSAGATPDLSRPPPPPVLALARRAAAAIGARYCGVDVRDDGGAPCILEINSNPSFEVLAQHRPDLAAEVATHLARAIAALVTSQAV